MPKVIILLLVLAVVPWTASSATKHKNSKRRTHTAQPVKSKKSKASKSPHARRSYQQAPTPDRYKEIQQALASKGYYRGEPNGAWGADSMDALKRFQADQNLTPDGKLNSLSLIALGLGPKRLTAQSHPSPATEPPKPEVPR